MRERESGNLPKNTYGRENRARIDQRRENLLLFARTVERE